MAESRSTSSGRRASTGRRASSKGVPDAESAALSAEYWLQSATSREIREEVQRRLKEHKYKSWSSAKRVEDAAKQAERTGAFFRTRTPNSKPSGQRLLQRRSSRDSEEGALTRGEEAARKVQKQIRMKKLLYRLFGPSLFVDATGISVSGSIVFLKSVKQTPWIKVSDKTAASRLAVFMKDYWGLEEPKVLVSMTGGAQDFTLPSQAMYRAVEEGLLKAATDGKAWIFTGGSDTGVMKLTGDMMSRAMTEIPVIGIFPWGCVNGHDELAAAATRGEVLTYTKEVAGTPTAEGAPLNPDHTHFLLVDSNKVGHEAWGTEIEMRAMLEQVHATVTCLPRCRLLPG